MPLTVAAKESAERTSGKTAQTYLSAALPFFTWLEVDEWQVRAGNRWDSPPEQLRQAVDDYLIQKLRCRVRPHKYGFQVVEVTGESRSTIRVFLSALKLFYGVMVTRGYYPFLDNPLVESVSKLSADALAALEEMEAEMREFPRMSLLGGTEEPRRKRRLSDSYFRIQGDEWLPQVVDDPKLPGLVLAGGSRVNGWNLREECVTRILFESGGRISEVLALTLGDWQARGLLREANATSKGSNGKRVKFFRWHDDTAKLLRRYFDTERRKHDPNGHGVEDYVKLAKRKGVNLLEVPLFLTERGTPLSPKTFRQHYWNPACKAARIDADPHQARHWYVTMAVRTIYETARTEGEVQRRLRELVEYMKWKSGMAMIEVYQHYFDAQRHAEVQDRVHNLMEQSKKQAMAELKRRRPKNQQPIVHGKKAAEEAPHNDDLAFLMDIIGGDQSAE
ncbi:MAG TPA: site-specific integrase [Symbiobacteriaceae bacterium]|jgi:site-specific recombinase XerC